MLGPRRAADPPITTRGFLVFYVPLVLTSLISLLALPIVAAALGRMPRALDSLAAWPAMDGILFILQSGGVAMNEVVLAMLGRKGGYAALRRFSLMLALGLTATGLLFAGSPLGGLWFGQVLHLRPELVPRLAFRLEAGSGGGGGGPGGGFGCPSAVAGASLPAAG